jgi:phosphoadenosine phosphosulfate reductase
MRDGSSTSLPQTSGPDLPDFDLQARVAFSQKLLDLDLLSRIRACLGLFPGECGLTTGFGYSGMILLWGVRQIEPSHPIYFIDTGYHFPETLVFKEKMTHHWNLNVITLKAEESSRQDTGSDGLPLHRSDPNTCCLKHKVSPLLPILPTREAWMHALRRDQAITRRNLEFAELDASSTLRLYPLIDWSRERCWAFIEREKIPVHPLHAKGYSSIGCQPCTRPVGEMEHERAGRWDGGARKSECGLHMPNQRLG